jgi:Ca2+-binding EF-hand superfamily protein
MKFRCFPFLIGAGLLVLGSIVTVLANASMNDASHKRGKFITKKLDINNDGMINRKELTSRQDKRFQKLNLNGDGMIDKTDFNGCIVAIFEQMDSNGDGGLDREEVSKVKRHNEGKVKRHNEGKMENKTGGYSNKSAFTGLCPSHPPIRRSQNPMTPN